ncbi:PIN domain-containing protein [Terriglobus sp.]|uniref:PIN domain-containing protein n=1 Tax=Terriglobus sp. TaxID=1889013 RepID=UPI003AFFBA88
MGLILDSSVVIAAERNRYTLEQLIISVALFANEEDVALSSVGLTELVHGIHRADTPQRRFTRQAFISELLQDLTVYPYTREAALLAGRIWAEQQQAGVSVPYSDLLIGATALSIGYSVLTANLRHFRLIPGLRVIPFQTS